jgi:hypothetical protein
LWHFEDIDDTGGGVKSVVDNYCWMKPCTRPPTTCFLFSYFLFLPAAEDGEMGAQLTSSIVRKILLW